MDVLKLFLINFLNLYQLAILVRVLLSWFPNAQNNRFGFFIHQTTEPYLGFLRRFIPNAGIFDLSPLIGMLLLGLLQELLAGRSFF